MGQIITISGTIGSGKSTVAKMLAQKLGWQYYSTGLAHRKIAEEMGITTIELNSLANKDKSIDNRIDAIFKNPPWGNDNCVVDSRLAFHFIPDSFKVCLIVQPEEAGRRIFTGSERSGEHKYASVQEATKTAIERHELEVMRFQRNYHVNIEDKSNFDLIIDTTHLQVEQTCQKILATLDKIKA